MADETITQQPFKPLVQGGIPNTQGAQQQLTPMDTGAQQEQTPPLLFNDQPGMSPQYMAQYDSSRATQLAQANMDQVVKTTQGWMPHVLAVAAALKGNFGPAIALQQQKEQTSIGRAMIPVLANINELKNNGKLEEAYAAAEQAAASAGDRAPEVSRILQASVADIGRRQQEWSHLKHFADMRMDMINIDAQKKGTKPQDDIRYTQTKALMKMAKERSNVSEAMLNEFGVEGRVATQNVGGSIIQSTPASVAVSQQPVQHHTQPSDIHGLIADRLAGVYGLDPANLTNAMNGQDIIVNGKTVPTPPTLTAAIRADVSQWQGVRSEVALGEKFPPSPPAVEQMRKDGIKNLQIAMGAAGMSQGEIDKAFEGQIQREERLRRADLIAKLHVPVGSLDNKHIIDVRTGVEHPHMTQAEAYANPNRYPVLNDNTVGLAKTFYKTANHLELLKTIADSLPSADAPLARVANTVNRELNSRLGTNPSYTYAQTLQAVLHRDVEGYFNSRGVDTTEFQRLAGQLTGPNATKQGFLEAHRALTELMQNDYQLLLNQNTDENMPKSLKQPTTQQQTPQVQAPTGTVTPGIKKGTLR